jgi:hypothetical protein
VNVDFSDYIGFIISLFAIIFLFFRKKREAAQQQKPEQNQNQQKPRDQEDALKDFLRTMNIHVEEEPKPRFKPRPKPNLKPAPAPQKTSQAQVNADQKRFKAVTEERRMASDLENSYADPYGTMHKGPHADAYEVIQKSQETRLQQSLERLNSKQELVFLQDIIGPPKGLR